VEEKSGTQFLWLSVLTAVIVAIGLGLYASSFYFSNIEKYPKFNEIGDAIAGLASAVAFLWLIVTVRIQSSELKAQRKEMAETREAFEAQQSLSGYAAIMGIHSEFVELMETRIKIYERYAEEESRIREGDGKCYGGFWRIAGFYQRLAVFLKSGLVPIRDVAPLFGYNACWWYKHYLTNPRTEMIHGNSGEMENAMAAWEIIKTACPDEAKLWETAAYSYH